MLHCIPNIKELDLYVEFCKQNDVAFEYNDFFAPDILDSKEKIKSLVNIYRSLGRNIKMDVLHGAFYDITVHSTDSKIRAVSEYRIHQSIEIAKDLGVSRVIFHTNSIPQLQDDGYKQNWLTTNVLFWNKILEEYEDVQILIENMFDNSPHLLYKLAKQFETHPRFGVCFDVAHAYISNTLLREWSILIPFIKHIHINDNDGKRDLHQTIGMGTLPWEEYSNLIDKMVEQPSVLIEVKGFDKLEQSVRFMKENRLYPYL